MKLQISVWLLVVVASPGVASAQNAIPANLELRDGSLLIGHVAVSEFDFVRDDGRKLRLATTKTISIETDDDRELSTIHLEQGPVRGVVEWKSVAMRGVFGDVSVPFDQVKRIEFAQPELGLIAHYQFDGDVRDSSGNENHGMIHGDVEFAEGKLNQAATFDGNGDYISVTPQSDVSAINDLTISAWVFVKKWKQQKPKFNYDLQYVFDGFSDPTRGKYFTNGCGLLCDRENNEEGIRFYVFVNETNYQRYRRPFQVSGRWRHLTLTRRQNREFTYLDGKRVVGPAQRSPGTTKQPLNMKHDWHIGTYGANDPGYEGVKVGFRYDFLGRIDDLRIYHRALNAHEIHRLATPTNPN